ncbi:UDP-rhamnose/UDP-galactose transporter [Thalictrum thalictroides]|uniref:UDP-rhamnose/UDP-galactose transporter n=1 Tax=Thalictrum thalictroides TaxID=46969 RepID=A0A7J6WYT0_THATH|nr:UDP-rhamnose/UDP-galactose transporter [Thalictrum thalictroides]
MGVAVCTFTNVSVNTKGLVAAFVAVWSTALQHMYIFFRGSLSLFFQSIGPYCTCSGSITSFAGTLSGLLDDNKRVDNYDYNVMSVSLLIFPCTIAIGTNLSQFICIDWFTAVFVQVLGHTKRILVLILGFLFFGKEGLNIQVVIGIIIAVMGMIWYGKTSSRPGGKERWSHSIPITRPQKHGWVSEPSKINGRV